MGKINRLNINSCKCVHVLCFVLLFCFSFASASSAQESFMKIDLNKGWKFKIDTLKEGVDKKWYEKDVTGKRH